jgi:hypothetical protein
MIGLIILIVVLLIVVFFIWAIATSEPSKEAHPFHLTKWTLQRET